MVYPRTKLAIPLAVLVAGASSAPALTTTSSFSSPSFLGGGVNYLKRQSEDNLKAHKLGLETQGVKSIDNQDYSGNISNNLEIESELLEDSPVFQDKLEAGESQKNIPTIFSEVKKEVEVQKIDGSAQIKVSEVQRKLKPKDHAQFKTALGKVKSFGDASSTLTPRARSPRSASTPIQQLSLEEKKSISDFFDRFKDLDSEKTNFSRELNKAIGDSQVAPLSQSGCIACIPGDLKKIAWTQQELNVFHTKSKHRRSPINKYQYYSDNKSFDREVAQKSWGNWTSSGNPYRYLFDNEQDWINSVGRISDVWKAYYGSMNSRGRITCVVTSMVLPIDNLCNAGKSNLEKEIDDSKAALELKIGTKLMNIMRRLNS